MRSADQTNEPVKFMKNTNNKSLLAIAVISAIALVALTKTAASFVPAIVIAGSYVAVAVLFAVAALDYGVAGRNYSAR